jgi:anaerobic selenocysteine-containing dehydrogenase
MSMTHLIYGPDRIKKPLIRTGERGEGKWREAEWDEVLDYVGDKMKTIIDDHGPESLLLFNQVVGTGYVQKGAQVRMAALLGMSFGTAYDFNGDISMGYTQTVGIDSIECETKSWGHAKYAILWSSNVFQTRIPDAKFLTTYAKQKNNCKIVSIDPRCSQTAKGADLWVPVNPGTDGLLALSMCHTILEKGLVDWEFLKTYTDMATLVREDNGMRLTAADVGMGQASEFVVWDETSNGLYTLPMNTLKLPEGVSPTFHGSHEVNIDGKSVKVVPVFEHVEAEVMKPEYSPEEAEKITDVPAATIRQIAEEFANTRPASIIIGMGVNHRLHGDLTIRSILMFATLVGAHGRPGEGVTIYSGQHHFRLDVSPWWFPEGQRPNAIPVHYFLLGKPTETINPKIKFPKDGFKGFFCSHANPLVTEWSGPMKTAIDKCDLFVVQDFQMTPTCEYADVILPVPTFWEKYELVGTGCHPYLQIQQEVVPPQYGSKTEFWIIKELIKRIQPDLLPKFDYDEFEAMETMLDNPDCPEVDGITVDMLKKGPVRLKVHDPECGLDAQIQEHKLFPPRAYPFPEGAQREFLKTGRMEFYKEEDIYQKMGETVPRFIPAFSHMTQEEQALPFCIVTPHSKWRVHSTHSNNKVLRNINRKPIVEIHPIDAAQRGIADNDVVEIYNENGSYKLWALLTESIKPGVLCVDHGWWDQFLAGGPGQHYHSVHTHQKIKPTHEAYYLPAVYAPGQHWKDTRVNVRKVK